MRNNLQKLFTFLKTPPFLKHIFLFLLLTYFVANSFAQTVKGKVTDAVSGEPLIGATVSLENTRFAALVNLDGSFVLKNIPEGNYSINVKFSGYQKIEHITIIVKKGIDLKVNDFKLHIKSTNLDAIIVTGSKDKESDKSARSREKNADIVQNILSAKTIELLPDVTAANALQRMSGVTIQRTSSGEGRYAVIRGMDQRYNNTLINGIKIPSPDDRYRYVPLDIFPSEMLERLEVIKSLTPAMEGDAIGGTMNLVMKTAPNKLLLNANVAGGYNTLFSTRSFSSFDHATFSIKSPAEINGNNYQATPADFPIKTMLYAPKQTPVNTSMGLTIGNRFLDKKLGIVVSGSYQNTFRGSNSSFFLPNAQPAADNSPVFSDIYIRQYSTQTSRMGLHNKIDYVFNNKNKISLYNLYLKMNEYQTRYSVDSVLAIQRTGPGSGNVEITNRSRWQQQSIYNSTLHGEHQISDVFKLDWSAVYSIAKNAIPDMSTYAVDHSVYTDPATGQVTQTQSITQKMNRNWNHNSDKDLSAYLNITYSPKILNKQVALSFGGLIRHKVRDNYENQYTLDPVLVNGAPQTFTDVNSAQYFFKVSDDGKGNVTAVTPSNYNIKEDISAGYAEAKLMATKKLQVLGGVRIEHTNEAFKTIMPDNFNAKEGTIYYTDVLPSLHLKYALNNQENIRLSYFKSISRPGFFEITPQVQNGEYFNEYGNPNLKHTQADNLDLRYEIFPGAADQLLIGAFYKYLKNPIEYSIVRLSGPSNQDIQPQNVGNATNYGFELVYTKYFGQFGVSGNYTYTKSRITTDKLYYYQDATTGQNTNKPLAQTRPLQGQSDHIGNLSLLYKNQKIGLDMQIAFVYTGKRISQVSPIYNADYWQAPYSQLDFSMEKMIVKHFSFYAKVNNLTNAPNKGYLMQPNVFRSGRYLLPEQDRNNQILVQKDIYKITFLGGFRYKF